MDFQNFRYIFGAVIVAVIVAGIIYSIVFTRKVQKNGIEADAILTRIEVDTDTDGDITTTYYVTYVNQEGQTVEAKLITAPPRSVREGAALRVKYLPEKPKYVLPLKR